MVVKIEQRLFYHRTSIKTTETLLNNPDTACVWFGKYPIDHFGYLQFIHYNLGTGDESLFSNKLPIISDTTFS
jgi:hypothetical protein